MERAAKRRSNQIFAPSKVTVPYRILCEYKCHIKALVPVTALYALMASWNSLMAERISSKNGGLSSNIIGAIAR